MTPAFAALVAMDGQIRRIQQQLRQPIHVSRSSDGLRHGTISAYQAGKCRCAACRDANNRRSKAQRAKRRLRLGILRDRRRREWRAA